MRSRAPLFGVLVALLLGVAFFFLLYQPKNRELAEVRQETANFESQASTLRNEIARLEEIQSRELEFRAALGRLEDYIPTGVAQSGLIRQFQLAADQSGVVIALLSFGDPQPIEDASPTGTPGTVLGAIPISMTVEGGYFQVVDFMRRVEVEVSRAVLVETLSVVEGPDEFPQLSSTWNGRLFAVVPGTAVAPQAPQGAPGEEGGASEPGEGDPADAPGAEAGDDTVDAGADAAGTGTAEAGGDAGTGTAEADTDAGGVS